MNRRRRAPSRLPPSMRCSRPCRPANRIRPPPGPADAVPRRSPPRRAASSKEPRMTTKAPRRLVIGISGASGTIYGIRMLELLHATDIETHLVMSKSAELTLAYETDYKPKDIRALATVNHPNADIGATIS